VSILTSSVSFVFGFFLAASPITESFREKKPDLLGDDGDAVVLAAAIAGEDDPAAAGAICGEDDSGVDVPSSLSFISMDGHDEHNG